MIGRLFFLIFLLQEKMEKLFLEENGETGNTQRESAKSTLQIPQENQKKKVERAIPAPHRRHPCRARRRRWARASSP